MSRLTLFFITVFYLHTVQAQVKTTFFSRGNSLDTIEFIKKHSKANKIKKFSSFDANEMIEDDKQRTGETIPFRFGKGFDTNISLNDGEWIDIQGGRLWSMEFHSKGAYSINFVFNDFYLAEGAKLYATNENKTMLYGPVTNLNNTKSGHFLTDLIQGDRVTLYLFEPLNQIENCRLKIKRVVHAYKNIIPTTDDSGFGESLGCNNNISCYPDWDLESDAVGMVLLSNGDELCSGALLMTTNQSFRPYFLSAFHCIDASNNGVLSVEEQTNAENWMFKFQYKMTSCNGSTANMGTTYNGAEFRSAWNNSDFTLMEMDNSPADNNENEISWLGWDRNLNAPASGTSIHHPAGDVMKISFDSNNLSSNNTPINWLGGTVSPVNTHWVVGLDNGTAEGGSSGSVLFNQNKRVVGQLHGGENGCAPVTKYYGQFHQSWTGGGTNSTRLSNWLNPNGSSMMTTNTTKPPYISGSNTVCTSNTTFTLQNTNSSSVTWQVSPNVQLVSSTNSNATIRSIYANSTSTGWIKASFDGLVITKDFGVNGDVNETPMSVTVNLVNNYLTITIHDGSGQTPYYLYLNNAYKLSTNSRTITFPYYYSSGRVEIRNRNSCDTGWNYAYYTGYFGGSGYYSYSISPNPVSDILTLERKDLTLDDLSNSGFDTNEKNSYELYDFNQNLVSKGQIANLAKIDVSGFKSGMYILLIITEKNYESHHIIIN